MSKVKILITGIAMGYKGVSDGKDVWKLLFPFNECHSLKFRKARGNIGTQFVFVAHLARPNAKITVSTSLPTSSAGSDSAFDKDVLDLTSPRTWGTHTKLKKLSNWADQGVIMTIENATFHVNEYLKDKNNLLPRLRLKGAISSKPIAVNVAHTVYAEIDLGPTGTLTVKADDQKKPIFESDPGADAVIWFDNDCEATEPMITNDMDLLYFLAEDSDGSKKQYQVFGISPAPGTEIPEGDAVASLRPPSEEHVDTGLEPNLAEGKPCMFVKVSDPDGLP